MLVVGLKYIFFNELEAKEIYHDPNLTFKRRINKIQGHDMLYLFLIKTTKVLSKSYQRARNGGKPVIQSPGRSRD